MRSVGWITLCFASCIAGPVSVAYAQSLQDVVSQTARSLQHSVRAVERAANDLAAGNSQGVPSPPQIYEDDQVMRLTPPDPQRKPRAPVMTPKADAWPVVLPAKDNLAGGAALAATPEDKDSWSAVEINVARAHCAHLFKSLDAVTLPETPIREGTCGDPAPVRLISIGTNPAVTLSPPPVVNCQMVAALHTWLEEDLQPLARKHLRTPVTGINVMSSYSCRNIYGNAKGRLSEHGRANALDIRGFETKKGAEPQLLAHWGPTKRDIEEKRRLAAETRRIAAEKAAAERAARIAEAAKRRAEPVEPQKETDAPGFAMAGAGLYQSIVEDLEQTPDAATGEPAPMGLAPNKLGGPKPRVQAPVRVPALRPIPDFSTKIAPSTGPVRRARVDTRYARFLRDAHAGACKVFGTVLGPEANRAHRNHLHIDLAERDLGNYCR